MASSLLFDSTLDFYFILSYDLSFKILIHFFFTDSRSEKMARSTLITAAQRNMTKDTIVVLDSLNYIKGFRYQLYCAAKEAGVRVCTVGTRRRSRATLM